MSTRQVSVTVSYPDGQWSHFVIEPGEAVALDYRYPPAVRLARWDGSDWDANRGAQLTQGPSQPQ